MEKSLSRDLVHSTILTSLQKLRVPDCSTSGCVTLNFWSMLTALNVLHTYMEWGGGKMHLSSTPRHTLKIGRAEDRVYCLSMPLQSAARLQTPALEVKSSFHPHSKLRHIPRITALNHCLSSQNLTQSLVHTRAQQILTE